MSEKHPLFALRALQLDLARSPETLETIRSVILFMEKYGYNTLFLYLEWRVATPTFHELPAGQCYTADDIREIVAFASSHGIDVIPGLGLFGHADIFFGTGNHDDMAEVRKGEPSRYGTCTMPHVFCPSNEDAKRLLKNYIADVAELFPSQYLHAGFDEAWEIGYCPKCRERALQPGGQGRIYSDHLRYIHDCIVANGKTMIIWDDLFDLYPEALEQTPRDVVLCAWHYEYLFEKPFGHAGGPREDHFKKYAEMGFKCWMAPSAGSFRNAQTFTDYSVHYDNVTGALMTIWEHFGAEQLPAVAFAGRLWSTGEMTLPEEILRDFLPLTRESQLSTVAVFLEEAQIYPPLPPAAYLRGKLNEREYLYERLVRAMSAIIVEEPEAADNEIMQELSMHLELQQIYFALRHLLPEMYNPKHAAADYTSRIESLTERAEAALESRRQMEKRLRPDRPCRHRLEYLEMIVDCMKKLPRKGPATEAVVRMRYHNDNIPLKIELRYEKSLEFFGVPASIFGEFRYPGEHLVDTPIELRKDLGNPLELRISQVNAFVANVVMYAEVETRESLFVPDAVVDIQGRVAAPEAILKDGRDFTVLGDGEQHARSKFNNPDLTKACNSLTIRLKRA